MIEEAIKEKAHFPLLGEWEGAPEFRNLYVVLDEDKNSPVGLIGWTGPSNEAMPTWWVRPDSRKKGYGGRIVELLAEKMAHKGVTRVGDILIDAKTEGEQVASSKLAHRLKKHFSRLRL
ncbi:MAG: GNAT family N-acetyltransferase [Candidatus Brocadiales bacterium]